MNVKALLLSCNMEKVTSLHFEMQEPPRCEDWDLFLQLHESFLQEIASIEATQSGYVILGSSYTGDGEAQHNIHMYDKAELLAGFTRCQPWEQDLRLEQLSADKLKKIAPDALQYVLPNDYDMETMPWEELLGAEVYDKNVCAFGQDRMAAMLIQEMSFWGLSYEKSRAGQEKLWGRLQEALRETEASTESYCTADELMAALALDDDIEEVPDESGCEDDALRLIFGVHSRADLIRSSIAEYRELLEYVMVHHPYD